MSRKTRHLLRLEDRRWHIKRLSILAQRGNRCESCGTAGARGAELHVHHGVYEGDTLPWDYHDDTLHVLCARCHGTAQAQMVEMGRMLGRLSVKEYGEALREVRGISARIGEQRSGVLVVAR